ncbi:MAG: DUF116 domain-containing protein [Endomicrobium sp.]|jgi:hypothetical protein|nr:DUF116 domain-containing protein [Endomicrobium sp.]
MKLCKVAGKSKENVCKAFTDKQNKLQAKKFASVPFNKRIVVVPHCMRNTTVCTAVEKEGYYICKECGGCKISEISKLVKELNYKALYVLKGGRAIKNAVKEQPPQAIVGIACFFEGEQAFKLLKDDNVIVQFVPLNKDGCTATDTNLQEVEIILKNNKNTELRNKD